VPLSAEHENSPEAFLACNGLLSGKVSPEEFAERVLPAEPPDPPVPDPVRREHPGPLIRRGPWSPLRRAWLCLQVGVAIVALAAFTHLNHLSTPFTFTLAALGIGSFSLAGLLLVRSSAVYEIRTLTFERRRLRAEAEAYANYAETLRSWVARLEDRRLEEPGTGATMIRDLLGGARRSMVAAGHLEATLLVLRHEPDRSLLTYSALPSGLLTESPQDGREIEWDALHSCRQSYPASYVIEFDFSGHRQELLALSYRPFRASDRLALRQLVACISIVAAGRTVPK
jgi:hypothetical protein